MTASILNHARPGDALVAIFEAAPGPLTFDELGDLMGELWGLRDAPRSRRQIDSAAVPDPQPSSVAMVETREFLRSLWGEIQSLRSFQRRALLLNLRDDDTVNILSVIIHSGIARFDEVAGVLEMSRTDLAAIWNDLPLPDARIADLLRVSRQQVINLRKAARERLARRLLAQGS